MPVTLLLVMAATRILQRAALEEVILRAHTLVVSHIIISAVLAAAALDLMEAMAAMASYVHPVSLHMWHMAAVQAAMAR